MKRVLLYSGGWDSYCASFILPDAKKLYVNLHTPYSDMEMKNLPDGVEIQDINLQKYCLSDGAHIPQRNAILALIGAASVMQEAEQDNDTEIEVYICGVAEDLNASAPDKSPEYFALLSQLASNFIFYGKKYNITIKGFFDDDKISLWEKAGKPNMRNIVSCYDGNNCGKCLACKRRLLYLNYLYPKEYKIDKSSIIKELQSYEWIINKKIIQQEEK